MATDVTTPNPDKTASTIPTIPTAIFRGLSAKKIIFAPMLSEKTHTLEMSMGNTLGNTLQKAAPTRTALSPDMRGIYLTAKHFTRHPMKPIISVVLFLLLFVSCRQNVCNTPSVEQWIANAMPIDSTNAIPDTDCYVGESRFHLRGLTFEQVEEIYGKADYDIRSSNGLYIENSAYIIEGDPENLIFKEEDYPITIISGTWNRGENLLEVSFVKYDEKWIAYDAFQHPKDIPLLE